ncbi:MAG TPA: AbgT family transporter [Stellaceae bacterium]|nr:AbgT family transporter [Stellaceae bacterium]
MGEHRSISSIAETAAAPKTFLQKLLDGVERVGNKVPHPAVIFFILAGLVILLSHLLYLLGTTVTYEVVNPQTHKVETATATVNSLLSADGIRFILTSMVRNFANFGPVAIIFVVMVGVGLAEQAGLMTALIKKIVQVTPRKAVTWILVTLGVVSSVASDAGYLVLIPLGAAAFLSLGRHPLAGLAAAFAGVAGVFGVNFLITPIDGILTEIANDAIHLLNPTRSIALTANFYFAVVSSLALIVVCTLVTDRVVEPRLGEYRGEVAAESSDEVSPEEARGLRFALYALIASLVVIALLTFPAAAPLRDPQTGSIVGNTPFMNSLIVLIMLVFLAVGIGYGIGAKTITNMVDGINAVTKTFAGLSGLIFLLFVISQFLAYFNYSNIATIVAVDLGDALEHANLGTIPLLLGFITITGAVGVLIVGAIPKWAIFAPIFVPLFMKLGIAPEVVLAAYRVGDSPPNGVSPLMPYFALIVVFAQRYQKDAGVGTVVAMMLPYGFAISVVWIVLFLAWELLGLPYGPA